MDTAAALLRAVLDAPDDDGPRGVYADYLDGLAGSIDCPACKGTGWFVSRYRTAEMDADEHCTSEGRCSRCAGSGAAPDGNAERAEFIRVQCDLARLPSLRRQQASPDMRVAVLRFRERVLWGDYSREWFGDTALWLPGDDYARGSPHVTGYVVRRGFVDELRLPLAAFLGAECGRCYGTGNNSGRNPPARHDSQCPTCHGTALPGLDLAAVFGAHPVSRVVLTDREPMPETGGGRGWHWTWETNLHLPTAMVTRAGLPRGLMRSPIVSASSGIARLFPTRDAADRALSDALVALGRDAAARRAATRP